MAGRTSPPPQTFEPRGLRVMPGDPFQPDLQVPAQFLVPGRFKEPVLVRVLEDGDRIVGPLPDFRVKPLPHPVGDLAARPAEIQGQFGQGLEWLREKAGEKWFRSGHPGMQPHPAARASRRV